MNIFCRYKITLLILLFMSSYVEGINQKVLALSGMTVSGALMLGIRATEDHPFTRRVSTALNVSPTEAGNVMGYTACLFALGFFTKRGVAQIAIKHAWSTPIVTVILGLLSKLKASTNEEIA